MEQARLPALLIRSGADGECCWRPHTFHTHHPSPERTGLGTAVRLRHLHFLRARAAASRRPGYASDLARRLRERGFTVFFSEDEAPAGGELDGTLKRALRASRVLVLVANRGTLREPRWVRTEVEEFRRLHRRRAVVPISIDGALGDAELSAATQAWLPFADRIWIDETREAGETGSVSDEVIDRLVTAPRAVRSAMRLRAVVVAIIAFFAVLAAVALWQRQAAVANAAEAERQRGEAQTQAYRADASASQARAAASAAEAAQDEERVARIAEREQRVLAEERLRLAQSRELAVSATAALAAGDPERAVLLAAAGVELSPSVESRSALRAALLEPRSRRLVQGTVGAAWGVAYSPDGRRLVSVGDAGAVVTDLATGRSTTALRGQRLRTVSLSADGRYAVSADESGRSHLWRLDASAEAAATTAERRIALSPDARLALHFGDGPCARLQAMAAEAPYVDLCGHTGRVRSAAFSPNGTLLLTSSEDEIIRVWDTALGRVVQELKAPAASARVKFSPDGRLAAAIAPVLSAVQLWDTQTWAARKPARPEFSLLDAVFTPDGQRMVLLDSLGFQAKMFHTRDGSSSVSFAGHTGRIFDAAFSPDGELLVTASEDKTARVWRSWGGSAVAVLRGHADIVTSARFSPDGRRIASSSLDGSSRSWEAMKFTDVTELNRQGPRIERTGLEKGEREFWFVRQRTPGDAAVGGRARTAAAGHRAARPA